MEHIVITAVLKPKEGLQGHLLSELKKVQDASREEAGCIKYDLHQSEDLTFVLYEVWKDEEALEHHIQSAHYQEYRNNIAELVSTREVYKLKIME
ncbi:putative quinol monooxygenase [Mesobacillus foraminis]|uniref:Quinol monooxygenase YgiN n=1 Tax=Mesobacillus foraminis TaxID=279826 RepID=A0A4R2B3M4_9BACI|nr:putative quinol monooxygenase [Mesobacillus foraminis]TCN21171.1 quinol monooxygenase YgiN [Mesobacillus foraminis]